jgi:hypothetical protein
MGIDTVFSAAEAYQGERGSSFLKHGYRRRMNYDTHHANTPYGGLQLRQVLEYCRERFKG